MACRWDEGEEQRGAGGGPHAPPGEPGERKGWSEVHTALLTGSLASV